MEIRLAMCTLRPWRRGDEPALARYANNRKVWLNLRDAFPHPYAEADAVAWVEHTLGVEPTRNFAIEVGGEAVGSVGLTHRPTCTGARPRSATGSPNPSGAAAS